MFKTDCFRELLLSIQHIRKSGKQFFEPNIVQDDFVGVLYCFSISVIAPCFFRHRKGLR